MSLIHKGRRSRNVNKFPHEFQGKGSNKPAMKPAHVNANISNPASKEKN